MEPTWPPGDRYESVVSYFADSLFAGLDANDLILQAETCRRHDVGAAPGYFPVSDARAEARLIRRVDLVPIPSLWGHVAGGGGDEGARPFINSRIAKFLRQPLR